MLVSCLSFGMFGNFHLGYRMFLSILYCCRVCLGYPAQRLCGGCAFHSICCVSPYILLFFLPPQAEHPSEEKSLIKDGEAAIESEEEADETGDAKQPMENLETEAGHDGLPAGTQIDPSLCVPPFCHEIGLIFFFSKFDVGFIVCICLL